MRGGAEREGRTATCADTSEHASIPATGRGRLHPKTASTQGAHEASLPAASRGAHPLALGELAEGTQSCSGRILRNHGE